MKNTKANEGFSLLELMVVITVIIILSVAVFRLVANMGKTNDIAETKATLEKTANAIEMYKTCWGTYPPVPSYEGKQPSHYECPYIPGGWGASADARAEQLLNADRSSKFEWDESGGKNRGVLFTFGLCSFFLPRYNGTADQGPVSLCGVSGGSQKSSKAFGQWQSFNRKVSGKIGDSEDDINKVRRILGALGGGIDERGNINYGIIYAGLSPARTLEPSGGGKFVVTNRSYQIRDAWYHELRYVSNPPYSSYTLCSAGPDGTFGTDDDIYAGQDD